MKPTREQTMQFAHEADLEVRSGDILPRYRGGVSEGYFDLAAVAYASGVKKGKEDYESKHCNEIERLRAENEQLSRICTAYKSHCRDLIERNEDYKAEADELRTAIEKMYRLIAIEREQNRCVSQRAASCFNGTFGIAVKDDPIAKQWQALEAERCRIEQEIRDVMKRGE
jgi:uncharacterized protein YdaT